MKSIQKEKVPKESIQESTDDRILRIKDDWLRLYARIATGFDEAYALHNQEKILEELGQLSSVKSDFDSLLRMAKNRVRKMEKQSAV